MPSIQHHYTQHDLTAVTSLLEKKCHQLVLGCFEKNYLLGLIVCGQAQNSLLPSFVKSQTQNPVFHLGCAPPMFPTAPPGMHHTLEC